MLVLSRQRDETIMIGDDIEITVVDIRGDKVRLGITAPATVPVHRKEVYEAIQRENREASKVKMEDLGQLPKGPIKGPARPQMPFTRPGHAAPRNHQEHPEGPRKPGGAPDQQQPPGAGASPLPPGSSQ
jgi:carbon storage regulator